MPKICLKQIIILHDDPNSLEISNLEIIKLFNKTKVYYELLSFSFKPSIAPLI